MDKFENAMSFFEACESAEGWAGCQQFVAPGATFTTQSEPLVDVKTVEAYTQWTEGFGTIAPDAHYDLNAAAFDESTSTAIFFATIHATHTGEGGPVPPTNKQTHSDYVYTLHMNDEGKVDRMTKIWNASWALKELGWM